MTIWFFTASAVVAGGSEEAERTELLVSKLKYDLSHVEGLLKDAESKCKSLEDELRVEKRRGVAAAMKAAVVMDVAGEAIAEAIGDGGEAEAEQVVEEQVVEEEALENEAEEEAGDDVAAPPASTDADAVADLVEGIFSKYAGP